MRVVVEVVLTIYMTQKHVTEVVAIIMVQHTVQVVTVNQDTLELVVIRVSFKIV